MKMNASLKLAGCTALIIHIGLLFSIPNMSKTRVQFDVQRAPSSIDVFLVNTTAKKPKEIEKIKDVEKPKEVKRPKEAKKPKEVEMPKKVEKAKEVEEPVEKKEELPRKQIEPEKTLSEQTAISSKTRGSLIKAKPLYLKNKPPLYPMIARRRGHEGTTVLKVEVLSSGVCGQIEIMKSSGHSMLDKAALKAVKRWKFKPARRGNMSVTFWAEIPIKFDLEDGE